MRTAMIGERFVADHIETSINGRLGDFEVSVVGRCDRNKIHALIFGQRKFFFDQFLIRTVSSVQRDGVVFSRLFGPHRIRRQGSCNQFGSVVEDSGSCVDAPNKGAPSASN